DDDSLSSLTIADTSLLEGNTATNAAFILTVSPASGQSIAINYATANGTAIAGSDYVATNGTVTFAPGQATATILVPIIGETANESNETFFVNLSGAVNVNVSRSQAMGTIINDDFFATIATGVPTLVSEGCLPTNGVIDPNESVTVSFPLRNVSAAGAA